MMIAVTLRQLDCLGWRTDVLLRRDPVNLMSCKNVALGCPGYNSLWDQSKIHHLEFYIMKYDYTTT